jgi:hypothetical protein
MDMPLGESGRPRLPGDSYATPTLLVAALVLGLKRADITLPPTLLDPCGGSGMVARGVMKLVPGTFVFVSDIDPDNTCSDLHLFDDPIDATDPAQFNAALEKSRARGVLSNPPFHRLINPSIVRNVINAVRDGRIEVGALMQTSHHALGSQIGHDETAPEPYYVATIACAWRSVLFEPRPEEKSKTPKYSHVWHVWTSTPRGSLASYPMIVISQADARAMLLGREGAR